jgi:hypothetical protein
MIGAAEATTRPPRRRSATRNPAQPPSSARTASGTRSRPPPCVLAVVRAAATGADAVRIGGRCRRRAGSAVSAAATGRGCDRPAGRPVLRRAAGLALRCGAGAERTDRCGAALTGRRVDVGAERAAALASSASPTGSVAGSGGSVLEPVRLGLLGERRWSAASRGGGAGGDDVDSAGSGSGSCSATGVGGGAGGVAGTVSGAAGGDGAGTCPTGGRGGSSPSGSTYPSSSLATRTPRWTCGSGVPGSMLVPMLPTVSPSATTRPRSTSSAPSCASVTA